MTPSLDENMYNLLKYELQHGPVDIQDPAYKAHYLRIGNEWYELSDKTASLFFNMRYIRIVPNTVSNDPYMTYSRYIPIAEFEMICKLIIEK